MYYIYKIFPSHRIEMQFSECSEIKHIILLNKWEVKNATLFDI